METGWSFGVGRPPTYTDYFILSIFRGEDDLKYGRIEAKMNITVCDVCESDWMGFNTYEWKNVCIWSFAAVKLSSTSRNCIRNSIDGSQNHVSSGCVCADSIRQRVYGECSAKHNKIHAFPSNGECIWSRILKFSRIKFSTRIACAINENMVHFVCTSHKPGNLRKTFRFSFSISAAHNWIGSPKASWILQNACITDSFQFYWWLKLCSDLTVSMDKLCWMKGKTRKREYFFFWFLFHRINTHFPSPPLIRRRLSVRFGANASSHYISSKSRKRTKKINSSKQFHFRSSKSFPFNLWRCDVWMHVYVGVCVFVCFVDACHLCCREAVVSNVGCKHQIQYKILNSTVCCEWHMKCHIKSHVESFAIFRCRSPIILLIFPGTKYYIEFPIHSIEKWFWLQGWAGNHFVD